jgi:hypothetical protein
VRRVKARYTNESREPNYSELKSVVSAMDGQARKAKWITNPSSVFKLDGTLPPMVVWSLLMAYMIEKECHVEP